MKKVDEKIYCVKCKLRTPTLKLYSTLSKNNKTLLKGFCSICKKKKSTFIKTNSKKLGGGLGNKLINSLKFEAHLPGHQFTGPGTNLRKRLNPDLSPKKWSTPINRVDLASYHHDLCYNKYPDRRRRNEICDKNMLKELAGISRPSFRERLERKLVKNIIGTKVKLGI